MKILVVEDEQSIREVIAAYLKRNGCSVSEAADGEEAFKLFKSGNFDLVCLDLHLPKIDGIEVCRRLRAVSNIPIIMVTARSEEIDELIGLEMGADDYIRKPFSPNVLVARVNALLRRMGNSKLEFNGLAIDPEKQQVKAGEKSVSLTTTQFNILYLLAKNKGRVYTRSEIVDRAYPEGLDRDILERTVDAHIKSIRKLLEEDPSNPQYVLTIIGKGYKFSDEFRILK